MTSVLPPIEVPQLTGGRERARTLVARLSDRLTGATVVVDFRRTVAGTPSFADELIELILVHGAASMLRVEHASNELGDYLLEAAKDHGASERLRIV